MSLVTQVSSRSWLSPAARSRWALFGGLAALVIVADQISKAWIAANFRQASVHAAAGTAGGPTEVLGDWVRIAVSHNDGGIFGLLGSSAFLLGLVSLVVIAFIVVYEARQGLISHPILTVALGLLLGGAVGNLIDRLRLSYVVDWVDMGIKDLRFYTFNVADSAISISIVLLIGISLLGDRLTPGPKSAAPEAASN
jgi:signal peptidase II